MSALLDAIRDEIATAVLARDRLNDRLDILDGMLADAHTLDGGGGVEDGTKAPAEASTPPRPPSKTGGTVTVGDARKALGMGTKPPATAQGRDGLNAGAQRVLEAIREAGEIASGDLRRNVGLSPSTVSEHATKLVARGLVERLGGGRRTRYRVVVQGNGQHQKTKDGKARNEEQIAAGVERVAAEAGVPKRPVTSHQGSPGTAQLRWQVLRTINKDPGALNDSRLSLALGNFAPIDIEMAVSELIADGSVRRDGDGTYFPNRQEIAA